MLSEKPWKPEAVLFLFGGVFLCVFLGVILAGFLYPEAVKAHQITVGNTVIAIVSFQGSALVLIGFFLRHHKTRLSEAFGLLHRWKKSILLGWLCALLFLPVGWMLQIVSAKILLHFSQEPNEQEIVKALGMMDTWRERLAMLAIAVLLVPLVEEMLFRGILYPLLKQNGFPRLALWGVSIFFAAMHFNLATFFPLFVLALMLTLLYERTDNLLAPIAAHSLFNGLNFTLFYLSPWLEQKLN